MSDIISEIKDSILFITFNRIKIHNAFDDSVLAHLHLLIEEAQSNDQIRVIVIKAYGKNFSAGADVAWMQRMVQYSEEKNVEDALILSHAMHSIYESKKPTIAMVQGAAFGGGAGIVAACDVAIASENATFCFSETKLGLIPAVISPYVIKAIGTRIATKMFISAEKISAQEALNIGLIHHITDSTELLQYTCEYAKKIAANAPNAVCESKKLVREVAKMPINARLQKYTASVIAKKRVSSEGQKGLTAFLYKKNPQWD